MQTSVEYEQWPEIGPDADRTDPDSCCICGFEFSDDETIREEELGHRGVNANFCYNCTINSAGYWWGFYSVFAKSQFTVNIICNSLHEEIPPVTSSIPYQCLSEDEQHLLRNLAKDDPTENTSLETVSVDDLNEDIILSLEPQLSSSKTSDAPIPEYPRPLILSQNEALTPHPETIRDRFGTANPSDSTQATLV